MSCNGDDNEAAMEIDVPTVTSVPEPPIEVSNQNSEVDELQKEVSANPLSFEKWMRLLKLVEQGGDAEEMRAVYNSFLSEFPLCYGYWRRYAMLERREGRDDECLKIFEKGVKLARSVELWTEFCITFQQLRQDANGCSEKAKTDTRELYERAVSAVGTDPNSDMLWDKYLEFEKQGIGEGEDVSLLTQKRISCLYRRIFCVEMNKLSDYRSQVFVTDPRHSVNHVLHPDELSLFDKFEKQRVEMMEQKQSELQTRREKEEQARMSKEEQQQIETKPIDLLKKKKKE
eukprot:GHVL01042753.1.p2 GENE.GHVL01042753.1~~GHVL01042753.1.p2  ORF type:complete len:309 (+),score=69.17 GHVL01042753.1:67-927(+)